MSILFTYFRSASIALFAVTLASSGYAKDVQNSVQTQKMNCADQYQILATVSPGDSLAEVADALGREVRRRELPSPAKDGGSLLVLDFMIENGHYENVLLGDGRIVTTPALTLVMDGDTIERIIGNPNRPDQPERSPLRGVPRDSSVARAMVRTQGDQGNQ